MNCRLALPILLLVLSLPTQACMGALNAADRIRTEGKNSDTPFGPAQQPTTSQGIARRDWEPESPKSGLGRKRVGGKSKPSSLIAADGTLCPVSADKFERVVAGDRVWCRWLDPRSMPRVPQ